jgi:hypothetical protein
MTWELVTEYTWIRPGQTVYGSGWASWSGDRTWAFHGVVSENRSVSTGPFRGARWVLFEPDEQGKAVGGVILETGSDVCCINVWRNDDAAPVETANVIEIWTTTTRRTGQTRYYQFSTRAGRAFAVPALEALAMLADGRAQLVERPEFLGPRR